MHSNKKPQPASWGRNIAHGGASSIPQYKQPRSKRQAIYNSKGQVLATVQDEALIKRVVEGKHQLRIPRAWAWDRDAIEQARNIGIVWLKIVDKITQKAWVCSLNIFLAHAFPLNRGHGWQLALPLDFWTIIIPGDQPTWQDTLF